MARPDPDVTFHCQALHCDLYQRACVTRQAVTELQIRKQRAIGQAPDYPHCQTERCAQGRELRDLFDPGRMMAHMVKRSGNGRREAPQAEIRLQRAAEARLAAVGLLDEVPTLDSPPPDVPAEGEDDDGYAQARSREEAAGEPAPEAAAGRVPLETRTERQSSRQAQGVLRFCEVVPGGGRADRVGDAARRDGKRDVRAGAGEGGRIGLGVRLGQTEAGGRVDRQGRRPGRVGAAHPTRGAER